MGSEEKAILTVFGGALFLLMLFGIIAGILSFAGGYTRLASAENVVKNYEWFFDADNTIEARRAQIAAEKVIVEAETDPAELRRLRVDLGGMQQSCRDLVASYNANASKATREVFKSNSLPNYIAPEVCE